MVHLTLLVGQLARAVAGSGVDHRGGHDLLVAGLAGLVKEEVDEGTLQTGSLAAIHGEAGAADLHAEVEVDEVVFLGQLPVRQFGGLHHGIGRPVAYGVLADDALLEVGLYDPVVLGRRTLGHFVVGDVGNLTKLLSEQLLGLFHLGLEGLAGLLEFAHLSLDALGFVLLALLHEAADFGSQFLGLRKVAVERRLRLAACLINGHHFVYGLTGAVEVLLFQTADHALCLFVNQFECKHLVVDFF